MDLSDFEQPIANEDGRYRAVVNGEFYGFESIRQDLEKRGHRFRTLCDSEIVLHLYEEYREGCLEYLRGEFAFILWDEEKRTLFAARDRFGIKPLFYAQIGDVLYLGSEAKALFAAGVPAAGTGDPFFRTSFSVQTSTAHCSGMYDKYRQGITCWRRRDARGSFSTGTLITRTKSVISPGNPTSVILNSFELRLWIACGCVCAPMFG